jgi:hypothetical protein
MSIEEINAQGAAVHGQETRAPLTVDPLSNWPLFAEKGATAADAGQGRGGFRLLDIVSRKVRPAPRC